MGTTPTLLLSCSFHSPALLLLCSSPASASALPRPYSCPAPFKLLSGKFIAPPQFLPSSCPLFCPVLLYSALLLPCSCPAHVSAPLLLSSSPAPTLLLVLPIPVWQPSSSPSAPYDFFRHGESRLLCREWRRMKPVIGWVVGVRVDSFCLVVHFVGRRGNG